MDLDVCVASKIDDIDHMPGAGFVDLSTEIPVHVSGFGPRALGLAGAHGDGVIVSGSISPASMEFVWMAVESGAKAAGRTIDRDRFQASCLTTIAVLEPGEASDDPRVIPLVDAFAIATLVPEEERFVTRGLIETSCMVGTRDELVERLHALGDAGLDHVMVLPPLATRDEVLRSIASELLPAL